MEIWFVALQESVSMSQQVLVEDRFFKYVTIYFGRISRFTIHALLYHFCSSFAKLFSLLSHNSSFLFRFPVPFAKVCVLLTSFSYFVLILTTHLLRLLRLLRLLHLYNWLLLPMLIIIHNLLHYTFLFLRILVIYLYGILPKLAYLPRRPRFDPRPVHMALGWAEWHWGRFSPSTSISLRP